MCRTVVFVVMLGAIMFSLSPEAFAACWGPGDGPFELTVNASLPPDPDNGLFATISDALTFVRTDCDGVKFYTISVAPGIYNEKLVVNVPNLILQGASGDASVVRAPDTVDSEPLVWILSGSVTVRNLTLDGRFDDPSQLKYILKVRLAGGVDDVTVDTCHFLRAQVGTSVESSLTDYSNNIVFRNNLYETSMTAIKVAPYGYYGVEDRGHLELTSQNNRMYIFSSHTDCGVELECETPVVFDLRHMSTDSRFQSKDDIIDAQSLMTGDVDIQAYFFIDWMPSYSLISGASIRMAHLGGRGINQNYYGVKIHGAETTLEDEPHVVALLNADIMIDDRMNETAGGGIVAGIYADKVSVIVSGGSTVYVPATSALRHDAFVVNEVVHPPYGVIFAGLPVETTAPSLPSDLITPMDQGQLRASKGLMGLTETVQVDGLVHRGDNAAINGAWDFEQDLSVSGGTLNLGDPGIAAYTGINFQNSWSPWSLRAGSNLTFEANASTTRGVEFLNSGGGTINLSVGRGSFYPKYDWSTYLGSAGLRWSHIYGHVGHFDHTLEVPYRTTMYSLGDGMIMVDVSTGSPRLCFGAMGATYCVAAASIECVYNCP